MFGRCAAISPSLWWNNGDILRRLSTDHAWVKGARVWIDLGSNEAPPDQEKILISTVDALSDILRNAGAEKDKDFKAEIIPGATHIETAWAKRFDQVLMFLFPPD
jgi:predicted alpha/beta superfamily hydrolase